MRRADLGFWVMVGVSACSSAGGGGPVIPPEKWDPPVEVKATFAHSARERSNPLLATPDALSNTVEDVATFAFDLQRKVGAESGNLFFSPLSIEMAMAMAWAGAKDTTAQEIATVFHFGDPETTHGALGALDAAVSVDSEKLAFSSANAAWLSPEISPLGSFLDVLAVNYGAGVGLVDFGAPGAPELVNDWVAKETHGGIVQLLQGDDLPQATTQVVLTNASYFKGLWATPFDPASTHFGDFKPEGSIVKPVRFMSNELSVPFAATSSYQAAALPYLAAEGRNYEMIAVLPSGPIEDLESGLGASFLATLRGSMRSTLLDVALPQVQIRTPLHLKAALSDLGMPTAFSGGANFEGIAPSPPLHIRDVVHQGFLLFTEAGTEAAAATAVVIAKDGGVALHPVAPIPFHLDHPFLVLIRHVETGLVLFTGRIAEP